MAAARVGAGWRVFDGAGWRMRQPAQRRAFPWRIVVSRTTAHTGRRVSVYEGNPRAKQINVAKTEAVQWS